MDERIGAFRAFLDEAKSIYHTTAALARWMDEAGYTRLSEGADWALVPGGKYYFIRGGSAIVAFRIPGSGPQGFMMTATHCDRPGFKLKENGELTGRYTRVATEQYGGMIMAPWLDRPLSVAGRVLVETENGIQSRLVDIDRDIALIPNVAIHMNRTVNDGYKWNQAVDLVALFGGKDAAGKLAGLLQEQAGGRILSHDLYLYIRQKAAVWGLEEEYISAAGLDDLDCVWGCAQGFLKAEESRSIALLCVFDGEEEGSNSVQGARSTMLEMTLERICRSLGLDLYRMLANSFMVSADNVHAIHPNHPELADPANAPEMNAGVVVKFNATQRYTTDALSAAVFRRICGRAGVPLQTYYNRADIKGGATLGHISLHHVSVPSADIGLPQLAMHSCYETAGVRDTLYLEQAMAAYYATTLEATENGYDW